MKLPVHALTVLVIATLTSHAKTFRMVSRFKTDSRSPAVHLPFERTGMPFERLVLSVLKNSSSVRTVRAIRSRKLMSRSKKIISRSNGSSYPFEKFISRSNGSSYPFEKFISRSNGSRYPFEKFAAVPTRQDFKTIRHSLFNDACRYVYVTQTVVTFLFFVYLRLI